MINMGDVRAGFEIYPATSEVSHEASPATQSASFELFFPTRMTLYHNRLQFF